MLLCILCAVRMANLPYRTSGVSSICDHLHIYNLEEKLNSRVAVVGFGLTNISVVAHVAFGTSCFMFTIVTECCSAAFRLEASLMFGI